MSSNKKMNPKTTHSPLSVEERVVKEFQRIKLKAKAAAAATKQQQQANTYLSHQYYYSDESDYYPEFEEDTEQFPFEEMCETETEEESPTIMKEKHINRWVSQKKSSNKRYCKAFSQKGH